jgi:hypothetical protein
MDSNNYQKLQEIQRNIDNLKSFMEDNLPERVVEDFRIPGIPGLWGGIDIPDIPSIDSIFNDIKNKIKTGLVDKNGNTQTFTSDPATHNTGNNHPTVKPIELMKYLIRLITPAGGTVLDPFNGSGSTGCAAVELGHPYIGCELDPAYVEIAQRRIEAWYAAANPTTFHTLFDRE